MDSGLFVATLLLGCIVSLAWPVIALGLAALAFSSWHAYLGVKILEQAIRGLGGAFIALRETAAALWHPLRPNRFRPPPLVPLPYLSRLANEVAARMGQPPFDAVVIVPEANFGVAEVATTAGLRRILLAGTPLLFVFSVDELRAVVAHEVAHVALRHTRWTRVLGRWIEMVEAVSAAHAGRLNPLAWSLLLSAWLMRAARGPWSRSSELDADALAAQVVGRDPLLLALRKTHEQATALELMMSIVAARSEHAGVAPLSWTEAAYRTYHRLDPREQRELRNAFRDDPFDVDGCSHPPFAQRSAALVGLPRTGPGDARPAIAVLPDVL